MCEISSTCPKGDHTFVLWWVPGDGDPCLPLCMLLVPEQWPMETTRGQTTFQARANLAAAGTDVMFTQGKGAKASENLLYIKCM